MCDNNVCNIDSPRSLAERKSLTHLENYSFDELVEAVRNELEVKDRTYHFKKYEKCFVGKELVVLLHNLGVVADEHDAIAMGNLMLSRGVFHHVTRDHEFKNEKLFYRFTEDEPIGRTAKTVDGRSVSWGDFMPKDVDESSSNLQPAVRHSVLNREDDSDTVIMPSRTHEDLQVTPLDNHNARLLDNVHPAVWKDPAVDDVYNMVVLGAGAGGLVTAAAAVGVGAKVAIIEKHLMGGDCLNVGCVPSKLLLKCAKVAHTVRQAAKYGVSVNGTVSVDFPAVMERLRAKRADMSHVDSAARYGSELGVDVFIGEGRFTSKNTIMVNKKTLKFSRACIATGGSPGVPPVPGLSDGSVPFYTNRTIFNLTQLPKRMAVIGAGPIGCELAQAFQRFGSDVHVFNRGPQILSKEDPDAASIVDASLREDGCSLHLNSSLKQFELVAEAKDAEGFPEIRVTYCVGDQPTTALVVDAVLVATGRKPNVSHLGLKAAGVVADERTGIQTDEYLRTSQKHIFAVGDCASKYQFTHMADFMARIVVRNALFYGRSKWTSLIIPWVTYTDPEVAHVGLYEADLKERNIAYSTYTKHFQDNDRAILDGTDCGFVKIHTRKGKDDILGATIVGAGAGNMISEITLAMRSSTGLGTLASVIHPYPTTADAVRACGDLYNKTRLTTTVKSLFRHLMTFQRNT